jgi:peptidoglycan L-alanyl-D-glutamate endopeptidase CwlK
MKFKLSQRSLSRLDGVHPDLVRVVKRAIEITPIDFGVTEGLRDVETQKEYFADGKSTTMNSKHLKQSDGYGHAVDLYCFDNTGTVTWKLEWFRLVIQAMFTAAIEEGVKIRAGGLWRTFQDSPHFELDR